MHECTEWPKNSITSDVTSSDDMQTDVAGWTMSIWPEERRGKQRKTAHTCIQISLNMDIGSAC